MLVILPAALTLAGCSAKEAGPSGAVGDVTASVSVTAGPTPPSQAAPFPEAPLVDRKCGWQKTVGIVAHAGTPKIVAATLSGDVDGIRRQLAAGAGPDAFDRHLATTALSAAAQARCEAIVRLLLDAGADPEMIAPRGWSPLLAAVNTGDVTVVRMLLDSGADPSRDGGQSVETPLHEAVGVGRMEILRLLIPYAKNIDSGRNPANNPLVSNDIGAGSALEFAATLEGREQHISLLLAAGATASLTALYRAVDLGSTELVTMLLDAGAPLSTSPKEKRTMVEVARAGGHAGVVQILEERSRSR
ncbi:MAG TPA: ankyrin repeat domain-containing protein [Micromonospora sp.]|nr:ankyrin repeat domain-containing protein [Micromonospora sp.]